MKRYALALGFLAVVAFFAPAAGAADLFNNWNKDAVSNGPTAATTFTLAVPAHVTELVTYHWNNAHGLPASPAVLISIKPAVGPLFGPFTAVGSSGQNGVPNVNWTATVSLDLPAGTYTVVDSQLPTWSKNAQSGGSGFAVVRGTNATGAGPGPSDAPAQLGFEYAVKFVCGSPQVPVVAPGEYFTAINVHNPSLKPVGFQKKIAIALPGEKAGRISPFFHAELRSDEALEIDCPDILRHADQQGFLKGFVVIQTPSELDVVAVYTAGHPQVETMEVEHVQPRQVAPAQIVGQVNPAYCPAGPGQVGNVGCCCNTPKPGGSWPDCKAGLSCVTGPAYSYSFGVCSKDVSANLFLDPLPPLDHSQPPYCGTK
ncbi:MAG TPA: hypothetical protein VI685_04915 [Candidatus Angelobacter sp.]